MSAPDFEPAGHRAIMPRKETCIYCGQRPGLTDDHVPPKGFFEKRCPMDAQRMTVPCCEPCRREDEKLDAFHKGFFTGRVRWSPLNHLPDSLRQLFHNTGRRRSVLDVFEYEVSPPFNAGTYLVEFHKSGQRNGNLRFMLTLSWELATYFWQMDWKVFHAPLKTSFVTPDNPMVLLPPADYRPGFYGVGIITKGARKVFPLTQTACLIMYDYGNLLVHRDADRQSVRGINLTVAGQSDRFVIGSDEALVRNMVGTTSLTKWKRRGRFSFG